MRLSCIFLLLLGILALTNEAVGCSSSAECAQDQCCGGAVLDLIGLVMSCQPYSKEGEGCHGSIAWNSCDCAEGLECVEHSGILGVFHSSKGICRQPGTPEPGLLSSLFG